MRGFKGKLCLSALLAVVAATLLAAPAQGALHPFLGVAATSMPDTAGPVPFDDPCGVDVSPMGTIYVADYQNRTIGTGSAQIGFDSKTEKYVFAGVSLTTAIKGPPSTNFACQLALDSVGNLYAGDYHQGALKYEFGQAPAITVDPVTSTGVAVDQATDRLYVNHGTYVSVREPNGTEVAQIGVGALLDSYGAAVSDFPPTQGYLYLADAGDDTVKVFDPATDLVNPIQVIDGSEVPLGEFRDLTDSSLAIDELSGHLFVIDNLQSGFYRPIAAVYEFDETGAYLGQLPTPIVHGGPSGIAVETSGGVTSGVIYVTSGNEGGSSELLAFCPTVPTSAPLLGACPASGPSHPVEVARSGSGQGLVGSALPGLDCGTICAWEFDQGGAVTLFATPRPHSAFTGWSVSGQPSACPGAGSCKVTVNAATEVTANFTAIPQQTLAVSKAGNGTGAVTSSPAGIECGAICTSTFDQGSTVTLTAEANPGSEFAGWSGAGCSGMGACQVSMAGAQNVTASFNAIPRLVPVDRSSAKRTLSISVTGEGSGTITSDPGGIECGTPCSAAYAPGTKVTLSAKPDGESAFSGWSGCDSSSATSCTLTLGSSRTVGASFREAAPKKKPGCAKKGKAKAKGKAKCKAKNAKKKAKQKQKGGKK